ncbi:MAG: IS3 family transposase [Acidobacteria bacterium]|nr:IS3 family transposase [Acidobacteriota bacterium]
MSRKVSLSTGKRYGIARVCWVWGCARSTVYARRADRAPARKRGPKTALSDADLLTVISQVLARAETLGFRGEGHRKVWARLRQRRVRTSKRRVLRIMREHALLAPQRLSAARGPRVHDGTLIPKAPNAMWGTDATSAGTRLEGYAWVFITIDHYTGECVGIHAAKPGTRFEALEPIRQGVSEYVGTLAADTARGLVLRHDHGSQYVADAFQDELAFLGIASEPSFVRSPEGNGVAERFIRTLKEQLLWVEHYDTVEALRLALLDFKQRYNRSWILERHGYMTPSQARANWFATQTEAA